MNSCSRNKNKQSQVAEPEKKTAPKEPVYKSLYNTEPLSSDDEEALRSYETTRKEPETELAISDIP